MGDQSPDRTPRPHLRPHPRLQAVQQTPEQAALPASSSPLSSVRFDLSPLQYTEAVDPSVQHATGPVASSSDASLNTAQQPRSRLTKGIKLEKTLQLLEDLRFSVGDFVEAYLTEPLPTKVLEVGRRKSIFKKAIERVTASGAVSIGDDEADSVSYLTFQDEFDALIDEPLFGQYEPSSGLAEVNFDGSELTLAEKAPEWSKFLGVLLQNQRCNWNSYSLKSKKGSALKGQAYLITSIILRARARKRCNYLARLLGLYLHGSGTKRRVIETLSGLGICDSYKIVNQMVSKIAKTTEVL